MSVSQAPHGSSSASWIRAASSWMAGDTWNVVDTRSMNSWLRQPPA